MAIDTPNVLPLLGYDLKPAWRCHFRLLSLLVNCGFFKVWNCICLHTLSTWQGALSSRQSITIVLNLHSFLGTLQQLNLNLWQQDLLFPVLMSQHLRPHLSSRSQGMNIILHCQICLRYCDMKVKSLDGPLMSENSWIPLFCTICRNI